MSRLYGFVLYHDTVNMYTVIIAYLFIIYIYKYCAVRRCPRVQRQYDGFQIIQSRLW